MLVITVFQLAIIRQPFPELLEVFIGAVLVVAGLMLFVRGLEMGLFPIGEALAIAFARKGSLAWLLIFGFGLGFSTTVAEPALISITQEAAKVASQANIIASDKHAAEAYALKLRLTVAVSVGMAICIGIIRILRGWPIHYLIISGYVIVILMTLIAPKEIVGIAYDSGGVTTSTVTVPLVTALGGWPCFFYSWPQPPGGRLWPHCFGLSVSHGFCHGIRHDLFWRKNGGIDEHLA